MHWDSTGTAHGANGRMYFVQSRSHAGRHGDRMHELFEWNPKVQQWEPVPNTMRSRQPAVRRLAEKLEQQRRNTNPNDWAGRGSMSPESIRIAVAESLGWRMVEGVRAYPPKAIVDQWLKACPDLLAVDHMVVPDYPNDLNACAEMEAGFHKDFEASELYAYHLNRVVYRTKHSGVGINFAVLNATAPQRCEAYLRTKGIWRG